jgi:nitrous oxidase accessory protein NosD
MAVVVAMLAATMVIGAGVANATTQVPVTPSTPGPWTFSQEGVATGAFQSGPSTPPLGAGSYGYTVPNGTDGARARNDSMAGTDLADLTALTYSTYVSANQNCQAPYLVIVVDLDGVSGPDDALFMEPCYQDGGYGMGTSSTIMIQPAVALDTWQTWDAMDAGWWANSGAFGSAGGPPLFTLDDYLGAHPDVTIERIQVNAGFGVAITAAADNVTIGIDGIDTTYDFEPDPVCSSVCYVDDSGNDANPGTSPALAKRHIQAAIDQVDANGQVRVLPGTYNETAPNSAPTSLGGTYQFGLFFGSAKPGVTVMGVSDADVPITSAAGVQATVTTNATNNFGYSGIFVEAANTTIRGIEIGPNAAGDNKTIEVVADNFTLKDSATDIPNGGGSIYINDFSAGGTVVKDYHVLDNSFPDGTSVDISSGAGSTTPLTASNREIKENAFDLGAGNWNAISFNGSGTGVPWFTNTVGGAVIEGNSFTGGSLQYIRARGTYPNAQFDWQSFWNDNDYDKGAVALVTEAPFDVRTFSYTSGPYTFNDVRRIGATIEGEVTNAVSGDTVLVKPGLYPEHVTVDKPLTLKGANAGTPGNGVRGPESRITGDASGALQMTADDTTVDGFKIQSASNGLGAGIHMAPTISGALIQNNLITGNQIGIYANGDGPSLITRNLFDANNEPGSSGGAGIYAEYTDGLTVEDNEFTHHTENNPMLFAATGPDTHVNLTVKNNSLHDNEFGIYALSIQGGWFEANTISVPDATALSLDGGVKNVTVTKNVVTNSLRGVRVRDGGYGYGANANIAVNRNSFTGTGDYAIGNVSGYVGTLNGICNWFGRASGPLPSEISGAVDAHPWLTSSNLNGVCFTVQVLPPLDGAAENLVKRGQVVPVQIRVLDGNGIPIPGLTPEIRLLKGDKTSVDETNDNTVTASVSSADTGTTMRPVDNKYIYNLLIPSDAVVNSEYTIRIRPFSPISSEYTDIALRIRK